MRPKEEINDFMKNNRLKFKNKEIKLKKEKKDIILKKFINFIELQKKIEENRKIKLMNKSLKINDGSFIKNKEENVKGKTLDEFRLSQNTSLSSTFNIQELYLSIYDAQKIYSSKDNIKMVKNHSMIIDNEQTKKLFNKYNDNKVVNDKIIKKNDINKKKCISNIINNKIDDNEKDLKIDKNTLLKIKNVITRLNNFVDNCPIKNITKDKTNKSCLIDKYDSMLKNANKLLLDKNNTKSIIIKNYYKKNENKKSRPKNDKILIIKKQMPSDENKFKKISMSEFKKIINHSQNNLYLNNLKLDNSNDTNLSTKEKKFFKVLNKNHSAIINKNKIKNKTYSFTEEQLNKYAEVFNYLFVYLKLFIQKKIFNLIILYANMKYKYISGFNQIIFLVKKKPFNFLRIIQQREYYQVILRQFYIPYLYRAFNAIKSYAMTAQKISDADGIIKQMYFLIFLKKMLFYIELKQNYVNNKFEEDKIIEEEKDEISFDSSSKFENKNFNNHEEEYENNNHSKTNDNYDDDITNNKNDKNENNNQDIISINSEDNTNGKKNNVSKGEENSDSVKNNSIKNIQNIIEDSFNKEISESYDEIKVITNTFNTIMNNISRSPKIYVFDLFKKYYLKSKNRNSNFNNEDNNEKKISNLNKSEKDINDKREIKEEHKLNSNSKNENSTDKKYNSYIYESLTDKSSISVFPNSEGSDRLHRVYAFMAQQQNNNDNNNNNNVEIQTNKKNCFPKEKEYKISQENDQINNDTNNNIINDKNDSNNEETFEEKEKEMNKQVINEDTNDNDKNNLLYDYNNKEEMGLFMPYKGEIKKNLMNTLDNIEKDKDNNIIINNNEYKPDISEEINFSDKILKNEFKKYEPNKKNIIKSDDEKSDKSKEEKKESNENELNNINNEIPINNTNNIDNKYNIFSPSEEEINLPIKQSDFIKRKKEKNDSNENNLYSSAQEPGKYIKYDSLNFNLKNKERKSNKRYSDTEDMLSNYESLEEKEKKELINISNELKQKIAEELTNEIIDDLLKTEIKNKKNILLHKKDIKKNSNSSIASRDSVSGLSPSPARKSNKSNGSQNSQNLLNNNESYPTLNSNNGNIQDEEALNDSIFKRTVYEVKKDIEMNYYEKNIFPRLLHLIEDNIKLNYINIINNLKKPLKKDDVEVMEDIANLIAYDTIYNNSIIKYNSKFYNNEIIKKEYVDKKVLNDFNQQLKKESRFYNKYYYEYLNQCIYDTTNEIIRNKRMYGNVGEPLLWSLRNRNFDYKYKDSKLFKTVFTSNVINELKKIFFSKIGAIIENSENINISQFSKERDIKFNENIREELKREKEFDQLDEQETVVKITIAKMIMNQLLNEVIEILEHIQYSRKQPEKYNNKSIFSCDSIPLLSFQNINIKCDNSEEEEEEKSEDRINQ